MHFLIPLWVTFSPLLFPTAFVSPKPEPLVCRCKNGGICQSDTSCSCGDNFSGQYCETEVRRVPTDGGDASTAAVVVPLFLVVVIILVSLAMYFWWRRKQRYV